MIKSVWQASAEPKVHGLWLFTELLLLAASISLKNLLVTVEGEIAVLQG